MAILWPHTSSASTAYTHVDTRTYHKTFTDNIQLQCAALLAKELHTIAIDPTSHALHSITHTSVSIVR